MTVLFSPFGNSQYVDDNGAPASGYTVETYAAGSSTPLATYINSTGATPNAASVTLNAAGLNPNGMFWLTSGLAYKFVVKNASGVTVKTLDYITGVNDPATLAASDQWVAYSGTPTYISATTFSVPGDQTSTLQAGRRVKTTNSGGTVYSLITASVFGAVTTVTVSNDSGTLDAGLSQLSYGLLSPLQPSVPGNFALLSGTAISGNGLTEILFTGIPTWTKRVTVSVSSLSTNGTSLPVVQLGTASFGISSTGYVGSGATYVTASNPTISNSAGGFWPLMGLIAAANIFSGQIFITLVDSATNTWVMSATGGFTAGAAQTFSAGGAKALPAALDRLRITMANATDTFDASGALVNILYE